jgi:hypothetical protein
VDDALPPDTVAAYEAAGVNLIVAERATTAASVTA